MPEGRQIGREPAIAKLETALKSPAHQWLVGERRIGKTSVAKAVLARLRKDGSVALDVDLSRLGVGGPAAVAGDIARQAQAAGVGNESAAGKTFEFARRQKDHAKVLGQALGDLGFESTVDALAAVASIIAGGDDGAPGVDKTLAALALHARATERRAYLLLDEVHLLAKLERAEEQVAARAREADSPIVFIFAGSEESAAQALREPGRPLTAVGEEFELADIAWEDWLPGLRARFAEAGVGIKDAALFAILEASGGHPRRTMMICSRVGTIAAGHPDRTATETLVGIAVGEAERDRSWR